MRIGELFKDIPHRVINVGAAFEPGGLSSDSRKIKKGELFIAARGSESDGHAFIKEAFEKGAAVVCSERVARGTRGKGYVIVKNTSEAMPVLASRFFGEPSKSLRPIGITGTNGKTTTSHLVYDILKTAGRPASLLGTVQYKIGDNALSPDNTTPGPILLHSLFRRTIDSGCKYVVMEVSSHALKQARTFNIDFSIAALTNITSDHLDYHGNIRDYVASKRLLFESLSRDSFAVLNSDDKYYEEFRSRSNCNVISYGIDRTADFKATQVELDINGSRFFVDTPKGAISVRTPLIGRHNVYNILAATAISFAEGLGFDTICEAIGRFSGISGRLESVNEGQPFKVFIDYAHTHDALENLLTALREVSDGRIILVFGCGGNRDRSKRPKMGGAASRLADYAILTNDNPRMEDPEAIIEEIEKGFAPDFKAYKKIPDRSKAIEESLTGREPSDIVVIAGKGHEDYQIIGGRKIPFNDRDVAADMLRAMRAYV